MHQNKNKIQSSKKWIMNYMFCCCYKQIADRTKTHRTKFLSWTQGHHNKYIKYCMHLEIKIDFFCVSPIIIVIKALFVDKNKIKWSQIRFLAQWTTTITNISFLALIRTVIDCHWAYAIPQPSEWNPATSSRNNRAFFVVDTVITDGEAGFFLKTGTYWMNGETKIYKKKVSFTPFITTNK